METHSLGRKDSNLWSPDPNSGALPLSYFPFLFSSTVQTWFTTILYRQLHGREVNLVSLARQLMSWPLYSREQLYNVVCNSNLTNYLGAHFMIPLLAQRRQHQILSNNRINTIILTFCGVQDNNSRDKIGCRLFTVSSDNGYYNAWIMYEICYREVIHKVGHGLHDGLDLINWHVIF